MPNSRLAVITFLDGQDGAYPDQGLPGIPGYPSQGLPVYPSQGLPPGRPVRPDNGLPVGPPGSIGTLPVFPFDPSTGPDNTLPGPQPTPTPPIVIRPGLKLVVKWVACIGWVAVPDNTLPGTAEPR